MSGFVRRLLRHPRRLGFIGFNVVVLVLLGIWIASGMGAMPAGLLDLPNSVLSYVGVALLLAVWLAVWIAWGVMVLSRQRRLRRERLAG